MGRLFGRVAHLLDAVEDLADDRAAGRFNPVLVTGLNPVQVRQVCDDAALGVRLALAEVELDDDALVHLLLVHELPRAVERTFTAAQQPGGPDLPPQWKTPSVLPGQGGDEQGGHHPGRRAAAGGAGCLAALAACGTCRGCRGDDRHGSHGNSAVAGRAAGAATAASAGATAATAAATADAGALLGVNRARPGLATT